MSLKILVGDNRRLNYPAVSISVGLSRLTLNREAYGLLVRENGTESDYVQILLDASDSNKNIFWVKLCDANSEGCRKLDSPSKYSRTCSIKDLIQSLNLNFTTTTRFKLTYDKSVKGLKVNTSNPITAERSE